MEANTYGATCPPRARHTHTHALQARSTSRRPPARSAASGCLVGAAPRPRPSLPSANAAAAVANEALPLLSPPPAAGGESSAAKNAPQTPPEHPRRRHWPCPTVRVAHPSRLSESPIRVTHKTTADAPRGRALGKSAGERAHAHANLDVGPVAPQHPIRLSESPIRVTCPSRLSESPIRVAYPSHLSESPIAQVRRRTSMLVQLLS